LVGKFENDTKQQWCLALRDGRQHNKEEQIILIDPGKAAAEWMKMKIGQALRYAENQHVTWRMIEMPEELSEQQDDGDFGIWICLIATTLAAILTQYPNYSLQEKTVRLNGAKTALEQEGREIISNSFHCGKIADPFGKPFCKIRIEKQRRNTQTTRKQHGGNNKRAADEG